MNVLQLNQLKRNLDLQGFSKTVIDGEKYYPLYIVPQDWDELVSDITSNVDVPPLFPEKATELSKKIVKIRGVDLRAVYNGFLIFVDYRRHPKTAAELQNESNNIST